jgi:uncharacterized protein (TIGR02001 family)
MKKILILALLLPVLANASVTLDAEFSVFSNFIWRGTTFTENKPAVQGVLEAQEDHGFYVGTFISNAEFSDEGFSAEAKVTQETDVTIGKRWTGLNWELQTSYNRFYFPGAGVFDTDEYNFQAKYKRFLLELSYMDDYFGYKGGYKYVRVGYEWIYKAAVEGALFVGYNGFTNGKGAIKSRCLDTACTEEAFTTSGAGNPDYIDLYFVNRKTIKNGTSFELAFNWTNRKEYTADIDGISLDRAQDFAIIGAVIIPVSL